MIMKGIYIIIQHKYATKAEIDVYNESLQTLVSANENT